MIRFTALTIKTRVILASTLVFGLALVTFATVIYHASKRAELSKLEARLESHSEKLQTEIEEQCQDSTFPNLVDLNNIKTEGLAHVLRRLTDTDGHAVLSDSALAGVPLSPPLHGAAREPMARRLAIGGHRYLGFWTPVEVEGQTRFVLLLAAPLGEVDEHLEGLRWILLTTIPATLLLTALAIFLIVRQALYPLGAMARTAQRISATSLSQRLDLPPANDEVRAFAETLNSMIERIDSAFQGQKQFVADASHELRTPLTVLNSELEYALKRAVEPEVRASLEACLAETDRLSRLVEGLLMLTRIDASQLSVEGKRFRLDEVLLEVVQSMKLLAGRKNVTIAPYVQEAVELPGDGEMIRRALLNLLDNAVKYTLPDTEVSVALTIAPDKSVSVTVVDRGPGMPDSDREHVFERFFRGENARANTEGSGLGLAIANKLIEANGGNLHLHSTIGQGTTVTIYLPIPAAD